MLLIRYHRTCVPAIQSFQLTIGCFFHQHTIRFTSKDNLKATKAASSKKYSNTLFLPRTSFPMRLEGEKRLAMDKVLREQRLAGQYAWQRVQRAEAQEFILHDGPPYANGEPHIGHAVNKILKDITIRFQCLMGKKIHYVTGWDCHGLPIELKAVKGDKNLPAVKIRAIAAQFAAHTVACQRAQFAAWGLLTDWKHHYRTMDPGYVQAQLRAFYNIYTGGFVFRDYMPVYWSPSSKTALAEAELEYNPRHVSTAVYVRFKLVSRPSTMSDYSANMYAVIWTTTPWSLMANRAICYNAGDEYAVMECPNGDRYIVAASLVDSPGVMAALPGTASVVATFPGRLLEGCSYVHPLYPEEVPRPFLHGDHVSPTSGTGLVHTAPAHGQFDFKVGITHGLALACHIDEEGRYTSDVGFLLAGCDVLESTTTQRLLELFQRDILFSEEFVHSYPYDWRTKRPVILRACRQWFIDTNQLKERAVEALKSVKIRPDTAANSFQGVIERRPYWCISRQRVWGCPIPVLYSRETGDPLIAADLIDRYCELAAGPVGPDFWWSLSLEEILTGTKYSADKYRKGEDILDIWFDSGISWSAVIGKQCDLYLEGLDQFSGWFYSSLLTAVALNGTAPFKEIFVHGFTLDEQGNKMSKSLGNVVDPRVIVEGSKAARKPALGVDVLRWWVGLHASSGSSIHVGDSILAASQQEVNKIRNTLRFLLGMVGDQRPELKPLPQNRFLLDQLVLHRLSQFLATCRSHYENMEYNKVCLAILAFISDLSANYLHLSKDRLYCDGGNSRGRVSGLATYHDLCQALMSVLAPLLPHLTEEASLTHSGTLSSPLEHGWVGCSVFANDTLICRIPFLEQLKESVKKLGLKTGEGSLLIRVCQADMEWLRQFSNEELCEVLDAVHLVLVHGDHKEPVVDMLVRSDAASHCERCRRLTARQNEELCQRCQDVLSSLSQS